MEVSVRTPAPHAYYAASRGGPRRFVSCTASSPSASTRYPARTGPLHTHAHAVGPATVAGGYNRWSQLMQYMQHPYLLLQHLEETFAPYVRNSWNTGNIRVKHQEKLENHMCSHCKHSDEITFNIRMKTFETLAYICNIQIYFCNIHIKHLQHTSETDETFRTYTWNIRV
jgi:hypothetical protein